MDLTYYGEVSLDIYSHLGVPHREKMLSPRVLHRLVPRAPVATLTVIRGIDSGMHVLAEAMWVQRRSAATFLSRVIGGRGSAHSLAKYPSTRVQKTLTHTRWVHGLCAPGVRYSGALHIKVSSRQTAHDFVFISEKTQPPMRGAGGSYTTSRATKKRRRRIG